MKILSLRLLISYFCLSFINDQVIYSSTKCSKKSESCKYTLVLKKCDICKKKKSKIFFASLCYLSFQIKFENESVNNRVQCIKLLSEPPSECMPSYCCPRTSQVKAFISFLLSLRVKEVTSYFHCLLPWLRSVWVYNSVRMQKLHFFLQSLFYTIPNIALVLNAIKF